MGHGTITELFTGNIPESLEGKTALAGDLVRLSRRIVPVTAMLVAAASDDNFPNDSRGWLEWCQDNVPLDKFELHHRRQIGRMLIKVKDINQKSFERLFELDGKKLLPIAKIPVEKIPGFLSHYKVENMGRDEVRDAVSDFLGEVKESKPKQLKLPGFEAAVEGLGKLVESKFDWEYAVGDEDQAQTCLQSGFGLMGAALAYHKRQQDPDIEYLNNIKLQLLDEAREIEAAISGKAPKSDNLLNL